MKYLLVFLLFTSIHAIAQQKPIKYYYTKDSFPEPKSNSCCIILPQNRFFDSLNKTGMRMWIDSCVSNKNARVYFFSKRDSIIKLH